MATRATIGVLGKWGHYSLPKIKSVNLHYDGDRIGNLLLEEYNTPEKAKILVEKGDILEMFHPVKSQGIIWVGQHDFERYDIPNNHSNIYHKNIEEFMGYCLKIGWTSYSYLYKNDGDGKWNWYAMYNWGDEPKFVKLQNLQNISQLMGIKDTHVNININVKPVFDSKTGELVCHSVFSDLGSCQFYKFDEHNLAAKCLVLNCSLEVAKHFACNVSRYLPPTNCPVYKKCIEMGLI